mgnify:FL=1
MRLGIGIILILISYLFFGVTFPFGALAVSRPESHWKLIALVCYVLNLVFFFAGLGIAGREAVRVIRERFRRLIGRKTAG